MKAGDTPWKTWTWKEYEQKVFDFAKGLISIGFKKHDTINIIGFNAPEWFFANFGVIAAGGAPAGIYTAHTPGACKFVARHSEAKVVVCQGAKQLEKYLEIASDLPNLMALVMYGSDKIPSDAKDKCSVPIYTFASFLELGKDVETSAVEERVAGQTPYETISLIYTSAKTNGKPKVVVMKSTHDKLASLTHLFISNLPWVMSNEDHMISFLPLNNIAAQIFEMHFGIHTGNQVWFAQPDALRGSIAATLKQVRPTLFFGMPLVWEKVYDKMQEMAKPNTLKQFLPTILLASICGWEIIFDKMKEVATKNTGLKKTIPTWVKNSSTTIVYPVIAAKVIGKVHVALGLDRCNTFFTFPGPIGYKAFAYFASINIPIFEVRAQALTSVSSLGARNVSLALVLRKHCFFLRRKDTKNTQPRTLWACLAPPIQAAPEAIPVGTTNPWWMGKKKLL
jgi:long-chain-fatty-acid--CoA ligase ACSBG